MNKKYIFILILISIFIGFFIYFKFFYKSAKNYEQYNSTKVSTQNSLNKEEEINKNDSSVNNEISNNSTIFSEENKETEILISEFTTKIYAKDKERQNNISITCNTLNNTFVENDKTFSFCATVGKATSSKGYEKADVYKDGEVTKALGGGNCQVSSTLYNAVLKIDSLKITERHEHSNSVPYVSKGKDAAVAYGSYDFKFVNNTGNKIKITSSCDKNYVYVKIFKLE